MDCSNSFAYIDKNDIFLLQFIPWTLEQDTLDENSCLKILHDETDDQFEDRFKDKIMT